MRTDVVIDAEIGEWRECTECRNEGVGKSGWNYSRRFEGVGHCDDRQAFHVYHTSLEYVDEEIGSIEEYGDWYGLLGPYLIAEDDRGFVIVRGFQSDAEAFAKFSELVDAFNEWDEIIASAIDEYE